MKFPLRAFLIGLFFCAVNKCWRTAQYVRIKIITMGDQLPTA